MIPKIIHYTWFSGTEMPQDVKDCINSWKAIMPDYELRLWDYDSIKSIDSVFLKESLSVNKWAFAADYVRLYALYHEGGIYLDTDVMIMKRFDRFLEDKCFIGEESCLRFDSFAGVRYLTSHCMGAEKGHKFIKDCLEYYKDRHFVISNNEKLPTLLRYNYVIIPYIQAIIALDYGYNWDPHINNTQYCKDGLVVYPSDFFNGESVYCKHLTLGSWRERYERKTIKIKGVKKIRRKLHRLVDRFLLSHSWALMKIDVR